MAQIINRLNFADFNNNLTIAWTKSYSDFPKRASVMYNIQTTEVDTGDISGLDGFSMAKIKLEGEEMAFGSLTQNYRKTWSTYEIALETKITWNMRKYAKYDLIQKAINNLAQSAAKRMEIDLTHRFTFANSTSYVTQEGLTKTTTVGDGLALTLTAQVKSSLIDFKLHQLFSVNGLLDKKGEGKCHAERLNEKTPVMVMR